MSRYSFPLKLKTYGVFQRCAWRLGKMLGGSSVINGMLYYRGNKRDHDLWAHLGNYGWSYEEVLPYYKKSEAMMVPEWARDSKI